MSQGAEEQGGLPAAAETSNIKESLTRTGQQRHSSHLEAAHRKQMEPSESGCCWSLPEGPEAQDCPDLQPTLN